MASEQKQVMIVGIDEGNHSFYALEWTLDHLIAPFGPNSPFNLIVVYCKPTASSVVHLAGPSAGEVLPIVESDLKRTVIRVVERAKELCNSKLGDKVKVDVEVIEGDARNGLCEAVEKHHASMLVVGSHGYGAIKRAVLGSVSDYVSHHAHCTVMVVKKPKTKH